MKNPAQSDAAISISSEILEECNNQNTQFAYIKNAKQAKNKTQYDKEGSQSNKNKQEKLIQLLICLKLLEMGIDWKQNFKIIQLKLQTNKNNTIEDVPRIVNQIVFSIQQRKNTRTHQDEQDIRRGFIVKNFFQSLSKNPTKKQRIQTKTQGKQLIECPICFIDTYQYFQLPCQHIFCKQCITQTINQDLKNGRFDVICPDYSCGKPIPNQILEQALQKKSFDRLLYFRVKQALQINPQNKFCSTPDCGDLLVTTSSYNLQCKKCRRLYCKNCFQEAHEKNCDEQLLQRMNKLYSSHKIKKCPKCKAPIQKIEGCNHMTCSKCQYSFCWICLNQYTDHHYRLYNLLGCPRMQFQDQNQINVQRVKQVCFFLFLPLLILLLVLFLLLFLPLFIILNFLLKPCSWIAQHEQICQSRLVLQIICCCRCSNNIREFLAYFILLPRSFLYAVFVAPPNFIYLLFNQFMGFMY